MAIVNPVNAFVVPFLFIFTVPLAVFAGITTTLAFSVLIFRVIVVYLDVALSLVPSSIVGLRTNSSRYLGHSSTSAVSVSATANIKPDAITLPSSGSDLHNAPSAPSSPPPNLFIRKRRRRPSSVSLMSAGSVTPVSDGGLGLTPSVGPERDYEGVGGWRTGDDDIWTTINSRLELPDTPYIRNHHRTPSGGPTTPGEGGFLMMKGRNRSPEAKTSKSSASPNTSRTRTPSGPRISFGGIGYSDGYFPMTTSPKMTKKAPSVP